MSILEKLSIPQLLCNFDALFGFAFSTNYQTLICSIDYQYVRKLYTLRRKNTDTFASVCSKIVIFKRPENYPKYTQNSWSFHQLIDHIGEASEWVLVTKFPLVLKIRAVKVVPFHFYFIKQVFFCIFNFDSSYFQNHWKFCNQNSFRSFPNIFNQLVKR